MKKQLAESAGAAFQTTVMSYPLVLAFSVYVTEIQPYVSALLVFLCLFAGDYAGRRLRREPAYLAGAFLPAAVSILAVAAGGIGARGIPLLLLLLAAGEAGAYGGMRATRSRRETFIFCVWLLAGLILYAVSLRPGPLYPYSLSLYAAGTLTGMLLLLRWNSRRLREAGGLAEDEPIPKDRLRRINRGFMSGLLLLILLVGGASRLPVLLAELFRLLKRLLQWDVSGDREMPPPSVPESSDPELADVPSEQGDVISRNQELVVIWLVRVAVILMIAAAVIIVLRILYVLLARWLPDWFKRLLANLRITAQPLRRKEPEAYVDMTEKMEHRPKRIRKRAVLPPEPPDGPRKDYVRLVREAVRRGYRFRPELTPTETGREIASRPAYREYDSAEVDELIRDYNRSRYAKDRGADR
ncbi:DUF4129 domain-containing protein [Saccharibacillus alkalitolerans]|uniref:DUF4129 domain-containing protein n=1 Tax=Saccharibacillus alkalitolerans TaxID=2705290 RepID=A0ABX0F4K8_9BACL|nr:DUF4129 domain-containing protein [Saccharibacillus alkalitolerans]NGZ75908.1 DUF4129 domain-containing protein [Saccharibacillus alkalitolerans]